MYVPPSFAVTDQDRLWNFMESHSFATLVSPGEREPFASHLPLLLDRGAGARGRLIGHMARANPQWQLAEGRDVLAIFHGPHAYISPTWLEAQRVVPTWNYAAVHACGTLQLETDRQRLLEIVRRYVTFYERERTPSWTLDDADPEFIDGLLGAIVGFQIDIRQLEGKWKLHQNHEGTRRERVVRALRDAGGEDARQIAELMAETLDR